MTFIKIFLASSEELKEDRRAFEVMLVGLQEQGSLGLGYLAALLFVLRAHGIDCHFTMGGHVPSLSCEPTLDLIPELDSIVRFEGEMTLLEQEVAQRDYREEQRDPTRCGRRSGLRA